MVQLFSIFSVLALVSHAWANDQQLIIEQANVSAYTSTVAETDAEPTITASGKQVRAGFIACPTFIPFGTKVTLLGETYVCEDRLGKRIRQRDGENGVWHFDIWMSDRNTALQFGRKKNVQAVIHHATCSPDL